MAESGKVTVGVDVHVRQKTPPPASNIIEVEDGKVLTREIAAALCLVNRELFTAGTNVEISDAIRFTANQLAIRLEKLLYTSPLGLFEVEYPASPWEHFRAVHFKRNPLGRWLLRRKPVRMHYERRSVAVSFPESQFEIYPTNLGRPVYVVREEYHDRSR